MTEEKKTYLTSDLAQELGVPRTTVNDWLNRYGAYLEFEYRGKRKAYSSGALSVLREVAALRDAGKSAFEVEAELARRHGLRPEVAPETAPAPAAAGAAGENAAVSEEAPNTALAVREEGTEAMMRAQQDLARLFSVLEEQEKQRHTVARRFWWMLGLVILLLLLAVGLPLLLFTGRLLERLQEERAADIQQWSSLQEQSGALSGKVEATQQLISALQEEQRRNAAASRHAETEATRMRREQQAELEKMTVSLDRDREDYQRNLQALQKELEQQRREAETVRQRWEQETGRRHEAELARLKEDFAVRQRELLEKLEKEVAARKAAENRAEAESETAQTQPAVANPVNPAVSAGTTAGKEQP